MTIDTQILLARQPYAWPAYVAVFSEPIEGNTYEDALDGRSHGHWAYRVTSRTPAGIESTPSEPTPPICCPDVVAPAPPLAHMALAGESLVKLRWLASPEADTHHYEVFAARNSEAGAELESMTPVVVHTPKSHQGGMVIDLSVRRPPGEWCFWIVAVDTSGNRNEPSAMLRGRSLVPQPKPPVWVSATREPATAPTYVALSWSHPTDSRLACLVERRPVAVGFWASVSGWLPRTVYKYEDQPPNLSAGWEYHLRVRDQLGQVASVLPRTTLQAL